jgi:hypothetical protein
MGGAWRWAEADTLRADRNFYGVLRVTEAVAPPMFVPIRRLQHGSTVHGYEVQPPGDPSQIFGYYTKGSGVELALSRFPRQRARHIGVVGLGVGTLAAYANETDHVRYYEINPQVKLIADEMFTFLWRSRARVDVVLGDGRMSLEREPPQEFDVLVLDAFSSDAIPVHLLTKEAFDLYSRHLRPDGVIAVNVTNRHLDLGPVVAGLALAFEMRAAVIRGSREGNRYDGLDWILLTRNVQLLNDPVVSSRSTSLDGKKAILWTDEHSSLWSVLK